MTRQTDPVIDEPSPARIYDYTLGGSAATPHERRIADEILGRFPGLGDNARANRGFLTRVVRYLAGECGIRQFLDIGSGLPTSKNVHQIVQEITPEGRVVYVDRDPAVVIESRNILMNDPTTAFIPGDLRDPEKIITHPAVQEMIDFSQPVAILTVAVFHFIPDHVDDILADLARVLPVGGYLALSIASRPDGPCYELDEINRLYTDAPVPPVFRPMTDIEAICAATGLPMIDPGLVPVQAWPEPGAAPPSTSELPIFAAVFRK